MAKNILLPDDILLMIIQYLYEDRHQRTKLPAPFWDIEYWLEAATSIQEPSDRVKTLRSVMFTCRDLYTLVRPFFYRNLLVPRWSVRKQQNLTWRFYQCLQQSPELKPFIQTAIIDCQNFKGFNPNYAVSSGRPHGYRLAVYPELDPNGTTHGELVRVLETLFRCPNMQSLTIVEFNAWFALEGSDHPIRPGTSPVAHLHLSHCGAKEPALASVLAWPAALKSLHYNAYQVAWGMNYETEHDGHDDNNDEEEEEEEEEEAEERTWTCAAFVRALQPQKHCLTELTLTRVDPAAEGLYQGPRIDLSEFTSLRILKIYAVFLLGIGDCRDTWKDLPPNIETLEVFYDDIPSIWNRFFNEDEDHNDERWDRGQWLRTILQKRVEGSLANLKAVKVFTPEWAPGTWSMERRREGMRRWNMPVAGRSLAKRAGVNVEIWIEEGHSFCKPKDFDALDLL